MVNEEVESAKQHVRTLATVKDGIVNEVTSVTVNKGDKLEKFGKFIEYQPGNGTRYPLAFFPCHNLPIPGTGDGKGYTMVILCWDSDSRAYPFKDTGFLSFKYVEEKFHLKSPADAVALSEIIGHVLERDVYALDKAVRIAFGIEDEDGEDEES